MHCGRQRHRAALWPSQCYITAQWQVMALESSVSKFLAELRKIRVSAHISGPCSATRPKGRAVAGIHHVQAFTESESSHGSSSRLLRVKAVSAATR